MKNKLHIYNTLSRKKEIFAPINPPAVGMYVCGPTVYGPAHLGHARPAITFDVIFRYLQYSGYKVRYVRNITDVGHLENDADQGEDKIAKKARLEQLEPMEVAQLYTNGYHQNLLQLNCLPPSIEPLASGHIIEQQQMVKQIFDKGFAYEADGSIYFDVEKYNQKYNYGKLSGRRLDDLMTNTRELEGQNEKRNPFDFALWKKAKPEHIMRWPSAWSVGFPGWHLECSVMSTKYLGEQFDIHGGGMDLQFPHHECEIAQSTAASGKEAVKYWMHNNMITINGQKMGKSLGNFITLDELFNGNNKVLEQAYHPMVVRFFILQSHYRNPLDFSNQALKASEKGLNRLFEALRTLDRLTAQNETTVNIQSLKQNCFDALNDDFNTPVLIANLFEGVKIINSVADQKQSISPNDLSLLRELFQTLVIEILGLEPFLAETQTDSKEADLIQMLLNLRLQARKNKDFATSDIIRNQLADMGIEIKDTKDGSEWNFLA